MEEMYKRTAQEVHSLKERLAERQEYARRSRASEEVMRDQMLEAKSKVDKERVIKRELTYGEWIYAALLGSGHLSNPLQMEFCEKS